MNNNFLFLSPRRVFILLTSYFLLCNWSCKEYENDNPYDTDVKLPAPTNVSATMYADTAVMLQWKYVKKYLPRVQFIIELSTNNAAFEQVGLTDKGATTYTHRSSFSVSNSYSYRIRARADINNGAYSRNSDTLHISFYAPNSLTATFLADTAVQLQWRDNSNYETGFLIEQGTNGTNYTLVDSVNANITSKTLSGVFLTLQTYYFRVRAKSSHNFSSYVAKNGSPTFPAPTNLTATFLADTSVALNWTDNSNFETGFLIE
ncbi:MAG: fibronectin type III domain-containing protein, partial [Ignavibacteria bacterium]|nr:fibronectin type III domain-containing protein [Ignavibacteria bacterium]